MYSSLPFSLYQLLKERKQVELEKQRTMAGPQPDLDKLFPPRTIPEDPLEVTSISARFLIHLDYILLPRGK